mgnify:CR=1 FL=1|jgi:hypothetical protein|tara:strand:+ start:617 stop:1012 length:396 start_codon:yes stop_codon:yes gene_type:complete
MVQVFETEELFVAQMDPDQGCHEYMRERDDGDFDMILNAKDGEGAEIELVRRIIAREDENYPNGRPSDDEVAEINRMRRNDSLVQSDWTQVPDVPASIKSAWTVYRQTLRDLPDHTNWPNLSEADWPAKPS